MRAPQQSARIANHHTIEKLVRGEMVKRKTHEHVLKAIRAYKPDTPWNPPLKRRRFTLLSQRLATTAQQQRK
jgi:hypothetical protein